MSATIGLKEYLDEIREQVCSRCPGWPPEGCAELGEDCGIEWQLPLLIDAIHEARGDQAVPEVEEVCARCDLLHGTDRLVVAP
jgi:hypothetical protein